MHSAWVVAAVTATALPVVGQDEDLRWDDYPREEEIQSAISEAAKRADQQGLAVVECAVGRDRRLQACRLVEETPAGFGFGETALKLAPRHRLARESAAGRTSVTRTFELIPNLTPPAWLDKPSSGSSPPCGLPTPGAAAAARR